MYAARGLKAVMTGKLAIGVARTLASEQLHPGALLTMIDTDRRQINPFRDPGTLEGAVDLTRDPNLSDRAHVGPGGQLCPGLTISFPSCTLSD